MIAGSLPGALPAASAPDFALIPPDANFDPLQLAAFKKAGDFKGKKVAIFYGADSDAPEVKVVQDGAQEVGGPGRADGRGQRAGDRRRGVRPGSPVHLPALPERGVNVVIGVGGSGSTTWPRAQLDNQSTYKPTYIATSESSLLSYVESTKGANPYLKYVLSALVGADHLPAVEGPGDQEVRRRLPQGLPVGHR